ncbi:protein NLRC5-like [Dicentrarchus labrax]|uniref:protein NLRC5-like n=1 Tax=Dicentrarchus labrax TaxID=13489 RepID=UPI0021F50C03|nr:protein NLRC5-like [Dicentrarchus labrax]XP_051238701.1 protein NLRC5-like [Dicentrarchus labrax]XP_051238702.1 protein NLRC5-like [Dicentrarchus labrax]
MTTVLPRLRLLNLSHCAWSAAGGLQLIKALGECVSLEGLCLDSLQLNEKSMMCLAQALRNIVSIRSLNLTSFGTPELCAVAASLTHCPLIQDVGLGWNNCEDKVAVELVKVIPFCQKLTRIDLESNSVSGVGAEALVRALKSCPALQLIRLWRNKVPPSEAHRLSLRDRRLNFSPT